MQPQKRSRQYKHNFKRNQRVIPDKYSVVQGLLKLNFSLDHVLRAVKVYEHNYGSNYNFNALSEIVVRLQKKDARKYDGIAVNEQEEEKRTTTQYLIDDLKHNGLCTDPKHHNSLSMSVSSNVSVEPVTMECFHDFVPKMKLKRPQLLRRHTDNTHINKHHHQYQIEHKAKRKKRKHKSISIQTPRNTQRNGFAPYAYMSIAELSTLRLFDNIDHRDFVGKFCPATIIEIDEYNKYNVKIHYNGYPDHKYDVWCNYKNEPFRFAKYRSISRLFQCINEFDAQNTMHNRVYKEDINVGDCVFINPLYTIFGGKWYKGIINKFDKKSDQIQTAFEPFEHNGKLHNGDYVLYWSHIDNTLEFKPYVANHPHIYDEKINKKTKKNTFCEWNTKQVIDWMNKIESGKFNKDIYDGFKQQIERIRLKGYELTTLNETALKFAGLMNKHDRKCIINNILTLVNQNNGIKCHPTKTTTYGLRKENIKHKHIDNLKGYKGSNHRVLNEVIDLWKRN